MTHQAKKRFGQNFLNDNHVIGQIVAIINPKADEFIVEIGPGLGALTKPLLERVHELHVIELDRDILQFLANNFSNNLIIHAGDALKFDYSFNEVIAVGQKIRVVGNLPYNISTPLLFHLAEFSTIHDMHFMLQKEVVERICAAPGNGDYGRLSIMLQYRFGCHKMLDVGRECFTPSPKVESAIVRLVPKPATAWEKVDRKRLNAIVTAAFSQRRKTIANSLKNAVAPGLLEQLGIDIQKRAENLTVDEYLNLTVTQQVD